MAEQIATRSPHEVVAKAMEHRRLVLPCESVQQADKWQVKLGKVRRQMIKQSIDSGDWDQPEAAHPYNSLEFCRVTLEKADKEVAEALYAATAAAAVVVENYDLGEFPVFAVD